MIYLDTSVVLAQLLAEDHRPPASLWDETLVASRLMEYEVWTRLHARGLAESHGEAASGLIGRVALLIPTSARARPGRFSRACSHARRPASGVMRLPAQPRAVGLACQLRPPDDHRRPRPGSARLRPGTLLNRATDYGRNEASDGKALGELLELNLTWGE